MKIKKLACITMACVMAISCLAVSAFAAESEQEMSITGEKNVFMVDKAASMQRDDGQRGRKECLHGGWSSCFW